MNVLMRPEGRTVDLVQVSKSFLTNFEKRVSNYSELFRKCSTCTWTFSCSWRWILAETLQHRLGRTNEIYGALLQGNNCNISLSSPLLSVLSFLPSFDLPKADRREKGGGDVISDGNMVWVLWWVCGSSRKNSEILQNHDCLLADKLTLLRFLKAAGNLPNVHQTQVPKTFRKLRRKVRWTNYILTLHHLVMGDYLLLFFTILYDFVLYYLVS